MVTERSHVRSIQQANINPSYHIVASSLLTAEYFGCYPGTWLCPKIGYHQNCNLIGKNDPSLHQSIWQNLSIFGDANIGRYNPIYIYIDLSTICWSLPGLLPSVQDSTPCGGIPQDRQWSSGTTTQATYGHRM